MTVAVMIDGRLVSPEQARVSVFDRGFLFGDSVFETIRTYDGKPFALDDHLVRLARSADLVYIPMPIGQAQLCSEIGQTLAAAGNEESYVRVIVTRGQGAFGLDPGLADQPLRVVIVRPLAPLPSEIYERGVDAVTFQTMRPSDATDAVGAKIGNYLVAVLATRAAKEKGAHEALIVDNEGRVVEGATSNLFYVEAGELVTPPERAGILPGITRAHALKAAANLGVPVRFDSPSVERLRAADEVFISSSIRELLPVVRIDGTPIAGAEVGALTTKLLKEFQRIVRSG